MHIWAMSFQVPPSIVTTSALLSQSHPAYSVDNAAVIHPAFTWPNKTLPFSFWENLSQELKVRGFRVVAVGTRNDYDIPSALDLRQKISLQEVAAVIQNARVFIGSDSAVLSGVLPATDTPAVGLLTINSARIIGPYRHGQLGWKFIPVYADLDCIGCGQRMDKPVGMFGCSNVRQDFACIDAFDPATCRESRKTRA